ncbi:MAG: hypothetical protein FWC34_08925 [Bacteroidetes bacterium]|nr:hypothetical protein [Bacteroidota bacterium]MCL2303462.1 hypothetical protein [Lentimicrobiaceae bacterium]
MPFHRLNLLLTFDYELPLGGVKNSYDDALFAPTEQLLDLAQQLQIPLVFFVDILSYVKFAEWQEASFCKPFKNQVHKMLQQGHEVQLHIHPHWLDTTFENRTFIPSFKYSLGDFEDVEIEPIIAQSIQQLHALCQELKPGYQCNAFRAGGCSLHRKAHIILPALYKNGIRYDSSVCKGYFSASSIFKVDFRKTPKKANWFLSEDGDFSKEGETGILEIPVAGKPKSLFEMPTTFKLKKYAERAANRGDMLYVNFSKNIINRLNNLLSARMLTVDNYTYNLDYLMQILDYNLKTFAAEKEISLALIAHPKSMGDYAFALLKDFVITMREKYDDTICFNNFNGIQQ